MGELLTKLKKLEFERQLLKLNEKLKSKTIVIYGAGLLFQEIVENYDLSKLNIIGIVDKKYEKCEDFENLYFKDYKVIPIEQIELMKPDYVLISTVKFLEIMNYLKYNLLKNTGIKICPLVEMPFCETLKEIFE